MPYTQQYVRTIRIAFMVICIVAAFAVGIGAFIVVHQQSEIQHETALIQQQRFESVFRACRQQNERNHKTIVTLRKLVVKLPQSERAQAKSAVKDNILLIDALAPVENCYRAAYLSVTRPPAPVPNLPPLASLESRGKALLSSERHEGRTRASAVRLPNG